MGIRKKCRLLSTRIAMANDFAAPDAAWCCLPKALYVGNVDL
jgi:hypothetical protein